MADAQTVHPPAKRQKKSWCEYSSCDSECGVSNNNRNTKISGYVQQFKNSFTHNDEDLTYSWSEKTLLQMLTRHEQFHTRATTTDTQSIAKRVKKMVLRSLTTQTGLEGETQSAQHYGKYEYDRSNQYCRNLSLALANVSFTCQR